MVTNLDKLSSGIGENTFIHLPENTGYGYGALDGFNEGLGFAAAGYRPYVAIFNFDVWFLTDMVDLRLQCRSLLRVVRTLPQGTTNSHKWCMTDCMFFKREFLKKLLPIGR
jgi:GT2 family glycosyltransferase